MEKPTMAAPELIFENNGANSVLRGDGFYVSYNGRPGMGISLFAGDDDGDETALCRHGQYFILNGDHREAYAAIAGDGYARCLAYFLEHEDEKSTWSDSPEAAA